MNVARRKKIDAIEAALSILTERVGEIRDEEQEAFDNLAEGLQTGERGEAIQAAADALSEAFDSMESAVSSLQEAVA